MRLLSLTDYEWDNPKFDDDYIDQQLYGGYANMAAPQGQAAAGPIGAAVSKVLLGASGFLDAVVKWLGPGYKSLPNGRYVSGDGLRQARYGAHETNSVLHHAHFEAYDQPGGKVIENTMVEITP